MTGATSSDTAISSCAEQKKEQTETTAEKNNAKHILFAPQPSFAPVQELLLRPKSCEDVFGHWVYTVANFATDKECEKLVDTATGLLKSFRVRNNRYRLNIGTETDRAIRRRLLQFMETERADLAETLFGQREGLADMLVRFSPGEPAVNVYSMGGEFQPHTDNENITILVNLSPPGSFEGGGTAFWKDGHVDENNKKKVLAYDHILNPPRGTAIIFGGNVTHAGLPVWSGTRHLFVMSFSLRPRGACIRLADAEPEIDVDALPDGDVDALNDFADFFS